MGNETRVNANIGDLSWSLMIAVNNPDDDSGIVIRDIETFVLSVSITMISYGIIGKLWKYFLAECNSIYQVYY